MNTIHPDLAAMLAAIRAAADAAQHTPDVGTSAHKRRAAALDAVKLRPATVADLPRLSFTMRSAHGSRITVGALHEREALLALAARLDKHARAFGAKPERAPTRRARTAGRGFTPARELLAEGDRAGALHAIEGAGVAFFGRSPEGPHVPRELYAIAETVTGPDGDTWHVARAVARGTVWRILHARSGLSAGAYTSSAEALAAFDLSCSDASAQGYAARLQAPAQRAADYCQAGARAAWLHLAEHPADLAGARAAYDAEAARDRAAAEASESEARTIAARAVESAATVAQRPHAPTFAQLVHERASEHDQAARALDRQAAGAGLVHRRVAQLLRQAPPPPARRVLVSALADPPDVQARADRIVRQLLPAIGQACARLQRNDQAPALVRSEARRLDASADQLQAAGAHHLAAGTRRAAALMREHAAAIDTHAPTRRRPPDRPPRPHAGPWRARRRPARPDGPPRPRRPAWRPPWPACGPGGPLRARGTPWRMAWPHHRAPPDPWPHAHRAALAAGPPWPRRPAWRPRWRPAGPRPPPATVETRRTRAPPGRGKVRPAAPAVEMPAARAPRRRGKIRPFNAPRTRLWPADTPTGTPDGPSTPTRAKRGT